MRQVANCTKLVGERGTASLALQAALAEAQRLHVAGLGTGADGASTLDLKDPRILRLLKILWENSGDECSICLDELEHTMITPCSHYFVCFADF
jgi:hypothetical protein